MFRGTYAYANIAIYPRKGTETRERKRSARGSLRLQFIPARGRKHLALHFLFPSFKLQFIPARGRKLNIHFELRNECITIYPRKGTEARSDLLHSTFCADCIYPRKGTKKHLFHWRLPAAEVLCFFLSYILFYRLNAAPAGIVFVTGSALTPCGTSGFMGRISCR